MILKYLCPTCNCYFELGDEIPETDARCPSCGEQAQKSQARFAPTRPQNASTAASKTIALGYLMALLFPLVGFVFGAFFLFKDQVKHGALCMIVSLISSSLWWGALISLFG